MIKAQNIYHKILILAFVIIITAPLFMTFLSKSDIDNVENRKMEKMPSFNLEQSFKGQNLKGKLLGLAKESDAFINEFDAYFADNFGFRFYYFNVLKTIKTKLFNTSFLPSKVVYGLDNWLFLGDSYSNVIKESKGITNFSNKDLNLLFEKLQTRKKWLKEKEIDYYLAIAPNKHTVYGQYLPIKKSNKMTKIEQLKSLKFDFKIVDLKSHFAEYFNNRLYHKTNTHWNDFGAFLGYKSLIQVINDEFPEAPILSLSNFTIDTVISYREDLSKMILKEMREEKIILNPKYHEQAKLIENRLQNFNYSNNPTFELRFMSKVNDIKVLIFRDSFGFAMVKYIKESFGECVFISKKYDNSIVEIENPDIVIEEIVERDIDNLLE